MKYAAYLNNLAQNIHTLNAKWWRDPVTGQSIDRNFGEMIALVHSELSEALEADRKGLMDDHLPHRQGEEVELADALIRILDMAAGLGLDIGGAVEEKLEYNRRRADHQHDRRRADHQHETRLKAGGKKYYREG